ncbi:CBN-HPR-9 protein [Caenorhabditis brenneri]|uniref:CBN-HPR-9 protein n=1 Tax=Caenorhabditis brenneri TaxID=135651 RepID=G0MKX1_CAEBE|nr:CBN-HPR-9 protein [Caenorhabditis brenneri]
MQATHDTYADPSSSTSNFKKGIQHEDMKGAQFVVQSNLKIMSRSIAALSKISEDVLIEVSDSGLYFKIVNRSKYCVFRFAPEFFNSCDLTMINNRAVNICRLSMKSAQRIFKGVALGEKSFVGCEFRINPRGEKLMVKLQMNYDIEKTIHAKLREMGSVLHKPTYDRNLCRNTTVVFASTLIPILAQMKSDIEVTMNVNEEGLTIRNFHSSDGVTMFNMSDQKSCGKKVKTETTITVDKLSRHKAKLAVEFSFSLKEFMAIVTFADQFGSEVCLYYDLPGKPLIVSIEAHANFDIELALATMGNEEEVDLDGGIVTETLIQNEAAKTTPSSESSSKSSRRSVLPPELEISSSGNRSRRGPIPHSQEDEHPNTQSQQSKNKFIASCVQEKTTLPLADHSWRDNEIVIDEPQREPMDETQQMDPMNAQDYVHYEPMDYEQPPVVTLEDDVPMQQVEEDVIHEEPNFTSPVQPMEQNDPLDETVLEEQQDEILVEENHQNNDVFKVPEPKRMRVDENRNKKVLEINNLSKKAHDNPSNSKEI